MIKYLYMRKHYRNIDVLKGICIIIVIIEHSKWDRAIWKAGLFPFWDRIAIPCFMVISGFVYAKSIEEKTLREAYDPKLIFRKLKRYLIPFLFVYLLETSVYYLASTEAVRSFLFERLHFQFSTDPLEKLTLSTFFGEMIKGGYGPGNYYTPVLIQLVFLFPLIYFFMKKYEYKGLIASAVLCFLSELWQYYFKIPRTVYRLLIFRHIMTICFGIYLALGLYKKNKALNLVSLVIGFIYIVAHSYYKWTPAFFNNGWADVNFVACLFYIPIIAYLIGKEDLHFKPLETIGKASFHIYLTQMCYYNFMKKDIMIRFLKSQYLWCLFSVLVCVSAGLLFYYCENMIRSKLSSSNGSCSK